MNFANIVIVTYNRLHYTKQCISSLIALTNEANFKITVVDNGSIDGTEEYLKLLHKNKSIDNLALLGKNWGIAKGCNYGWLKEPDASYFIKLDNDMITLKSEWLRDLITVADNDKTLGCLGYSVEGIYPVTYQINDVDVRIKLVGNLGGACLMIPKSTELLLGHFCEDFELYGAEDGDYGFRVVTQGLKNAYIGTETSTTFYHLGETNSGDMTDQEYAKYKQEYHKKNCAVYHENVQLYYDKIKSLKFISTVDVQMGNMWL
jgi:GT2 family glycosyltransferase